MNKYIIRDYYTGEYFGIFTGKNPKEFYKFVKKLLDDKDYKKVKYFSKLFGDKILHLDIWNKLSINYYKSSGFYSVDIYGDDGLITLEIVNINKLKQIKGK